MLRWADVLKDKSLRNLPFKVELDRLGRLILTPRSNQSRILLSHVAALLGNVRDGNALLGCSIETYNGVQLADAAWASRRFLSKYHFETPYPVAPEICVEMASSTVSPAVIEAKTVFYLAKGAHEVWVCDKNGNVSFYDYSGKMKKSKMVPKSPSKV